LLDCVERIHEFTQFDDAAVTELNEARHQKRNDPIGGSLTRRAIPMVPALSLSTTMKIG
jgi:hypothetical protein